MNTEAKFLNKGALLTTQWLRICLAVQGAGSVRGQGTKILHAVLCLVPQGSDSRDLVDCSLPGSSVHGLLQARTLAWVAMPSSRGYPQPRNRTQVSHIAGRFFTIWTTREAPDPTRHGATEPKRHTKSPSAAAKDPTWHVKDPIGQN